MVFKWNETHTLLFLDNFKNYPCLWNHKIDNYKDKTQRANAMRSLISDLNIDEVTEEDIKRKIKTIRTRYTVELSKIKHSASSGNSFQNLYVPTLYWFKNADFLSNVCVPRQSTLKLVNLHTKTEQWSELSNNEDSSEADEQLLESHSEYPAEHYDSQVGDVTAISNCPQVDISGMPFKRQRLNESHDEKEYLLNVKDEHEIGARDEEEHEFDLFCRSLAVQLKKMPLERALICQEKLQSVMVQERLACIHSIPRVRTPSPNPL